MAKEHAHFAAILKGWGPILQRAVAKVNANRWPSGAPGGKGGQFAPGKSGSYSAMVEQARGESAMARVMATRADVHNAMTTPSGRTVSFIWGNEKSHGIAHAVREAEGHGVRVGIAIPSVLAHGTESAPYHPKDKKLERPGTNPRVDIEYKGVRVTLVQEVHGAGNEWVLTAFETIKKERGGPGAPAVWTKAAAELCKSALPVSADLGCGTNPSIAPQLSLLKSTCNHRSSGAPGGQAG